MALTSSSSLAEVFAAYDNNVDYDLGAGDQTKAGNFISACRILLRRLTGDSMTEGTRTTNAANLVEIRQQLQRAEAWLNSRAAGAAGGVTFASFEHFRD